MGASSQALFHATQLRNSATRIQMLQMSDARSHSDAERWRKTNPIVSTKVIRFHDTHAARAFDT